MIYGLDLDFPDTFIASITRYKSVWTQQDYHFIDDIPK